ncbi:MAG: 3'-5' exonuclease domain-containing protein 2 [Verrucomicrobiaceae bacterium]|nr:MAG: 3'-5' exonuclease domain-containing protein 2 [Verrucomicrobiaceae bacterium]
MTPPNKIEIAAMEPFTGLPLERVFVVEDAAQAAQAAEELMFAGTVGFDTESKPVFFKGQKSEGPHVLQFSTPEKAFIFQSHVEETNPVVVELLKSPRLMKVGFGLKGDLQQISTRYGIRAEATVELDRSFRQLGYRDPVGAKSGVAILFSRKLQKSKSVTTSNWAAKQLSAAQLLYAANDAYSALLVWQELQKRAQG